MRRSALRGADPSVSAAPGCGWHARVSGETSVASQQSATPRGVAPYTTRSKPLRSFCRGVSTVVGRPGRPAPLPRARPHNPSWFNHFCPSGEQTCAGAGKRVVFSRGSTRCLHGHIDLGKAAAASAATPIAWPVVRASSPARWA